jgi:flagellar biosynthesis protein FlhF
VIALIGPTGVGKTTTIAKLAANHKLHEGRKVGLITIDTYRIAAVDQLKAYADIIEVPLETVLTPGELQQAVRSMADMDVVLIDTAGRSPNNRMRLSQLRSFLAAGAPDEVHLVVSATSSRACAKGTLEHFCPLGVNRIILTKLDEAETFGVILTAASAGKPLSYYTTGQDVPDDIACADSRRLAGMIVEESHEQRLA